MNENNGEAPEVNVGAGNRSVHFTDLRDQAPQPRINLDKYLPASEIAARRAAQTEAEPEAEAIAIAAEPDGGLWNNGLFSASDDETDNSGSRDYYPDDSDDDSSEGDDGDDDTPDSSNGDGSPDDGDKPQSDGSPHQNPFDKALTFLKGLSRKQWLIIGGVAVVIVAGIIAFALTRPAKVQHTATPQPVKKAAPAPQPAKPTSPLTGLEVAEEDTKRPVVGVMIENSTFARPQSGLKDAGVVYEAIAEYGITRFLALYQEANPGNIGPVRSARPYFADWAHSYDASYAHVGGSPDALNKIKTDGIRDLDQFYNSGSYHRISQREAPHNVYTSMQNLRDLTKAKGYATSTFTGWPRKKDDPAKAITAKDININISGPTYNVKYSYDPSSNTYFRTMGGAPHTDADSGARLAPKVVIGLVAPYSLMADQYHSSYVTVGTGVAKIFQDGAEVDATWKREGNSTYQFLDKDNKEIKLDAGQTWITVVGDPGAISFSGPAQTTAKPQ